MMKVYVLGWRWKESGVPQSIEFSFYGISEEEALEALRGMRDGLRGVGFQEAAIGEKTEGIKGIE